MTEIKLLREWKNYKEGTIMVVPSYIAEVLINKGYAFNTQDLTCFTNADNSKPKRRNAKRERD